MKLPNEFYRLPVRFDAQRLRDEVLQFKSSEWQQHPTGYAGNSAIRLITVGGGENDDVAGAMEVTANLRRCLYLQQVLAQFGVAWSRSRLMKLGPRSIVPEHSDVNYHWFHRVRIHIPIVTFPEVRFYCGQRAVHMAAGEAWIFDNWRRHRVENPTAHERIHLVADTTGNARFWDLVRRGQSDRFESAGPAGSTPLIAFQPGQSVSLLTERHNTPIIMPPSEVESLLLDLRNDLALHEDTPDAWRSATEFQSLLDSFCQDWRQLWSLFAGDIEGWPHYRALCEQMDRRVQQIPVPVYTLSNQVPVRAVLNARVLRYAVNPPGRTAVTENEYAIR